MAQNKNQKIDLSQMTGAQVADLVNSLMGDNELFKREIASLLQKN